MTEEVKRYTCELTWDGTPDDGTHQVAIMEEATGPVEGIQYVTFDDYVLAVQRAERAEANSLKHAALLVRAATGLGIPDGEKIHEVLLPAIQNLRAVLNMELQGVGVGHGGLLVLRADLPASMSDTVAIARTIAQANHCSVVVLSDGQELSSLSVDDMGAAGWVPKQ